MVKFSHFRQAEKQTGKKLIPKEPWLSPAATGIWNLWQELRPRVGSGFGPSDISHTELRAWMLNNGLRLTGFELDCILTVHRTWLRYLTAKEDQAPPPESRT